MQWLIICLLLMFPLVAQQKILAFAGSTREGSYNKKLVQEAAAIARQKGALVTVIDLKDFPMPFYDADLEKKGMPENAKKLFDLMVNSDGFIIASPEYNRSFSAVLKNSLDWISRGKGAMEGKKVALMSASPGKKGGIKSLTQLRDVIDDIGGVILAKQVTVPRANTAFNEKGELIDPALKQALEEEIEQLFSSL